jgi:hypothetical protein
MADYFNAIQDGRFLVRHGINDLKGHDFGLAASTRVAAAFSPWEISSFAYTPHK